MTDVEEEVGGTRCPDQRFNWQRERAVKTLVPLPSTSSTLAVPLSTPDLLSWWWGLKAQNVSFHHQGEEEGWTGWRNRGGVNRQVGRGSGQWMPGQPTGSFSLMVGWHPGTTVVHFLSALGPEPHLSVTYHPTPQARTQGLKAPKTLSPSVWCGLAG